jgi:hypothetical protein
MDDKSQQNLLKCSHLGMLGFIVNSLELTYCRLLTPTHQHDAWGQQLGRAKQGKHKLPLQKRKYHLQDPRQKHYTKKRFPANT